MGDRAARSIFLAFALLYICTTRGHFTVTSEINDYQTSRSLWEHGDLRVGFLLGSLPGRDGRYSQHGVGQAVAALPLFALGRVIRLELERFGRTDWVEVFAGPSIGVEPTRWGGDVEIFFANLLNCIVTALVCAAYFRFSQTLGASVHAAFAATVLLGLTTYVAPFSAGFLTHPSDTLLLMMALHALVRNARAPSWRMRAWAGTCVAMMLHFRVPSVLTWPALLGYLIWSAAQHGPGDEHGRTSLRAVLRELPGFMGPLAVGILLHCAVTYLKFQTLWVKYDAAGGFDTPLLVGLYGFLLSPGASVFVYTPLLVLTPWMFRWFLRRSPAEAATLLALAASYLVTCSKFTSWHGLTDAVGPRYLSPTVPLLLLPLGSWMDAVGKRAWWAVLPLAALGLWVQILQIAVNFSYLFHYEGYAEYVPRLSFLFIPDVSPLAAHWKALCAFDYRVDMWLLNVYRDGGWMKFAAVGTPLFAALGVSAWRVAVAVREATESARPGCAENARR